MATPDTQIINLRIPASLKQAIQEAAQANRRSLNSELLIALEQAYANPHSERDKLVKNQ
jgi:hypothetical protein